MKHFNSLLLLLASISMANASPITTPNNPTGIELFAMNSPINACTREDVEKCDACHHQCSKAAVWPPAYGICKLVCKKKDLCKRAGECHEQMKAELTRAEQEAKTKDDKDNIEKAKKQQEEKEKEQKEKEKQPLAMA